MRKPKYQGDTSKCKPGLFCLECPYPDCVITVVRVKPEETELLKGIGLADARKEKAIKEKRD